MTNRILIVDDEAPVLAALQRALRSRFGPRLEISTRTDALEALAMLRVTPFDVVVSDQRMPDIDGVSFLSLVAALQPGSVRMILTGSADFDSAQRAIQDAGVFRYLTKPWSDAELVAHIEAALSVAASRRRSGDDGHLIDSDELERRRLEALEPGITHVDWGPMGEVCMPPLPELDAPEGNGPGAGKSS